MEGRLLWQVKAEHSHDTSVEAINIPLSAAQSNTSSDSFDKDKAYSRNEGFCSYELRVNSSGTISIPPKSVPSIRRILLSIPREYCTNH